MKIGAKIDFQDRAWRPTGDADGVFFVGETTTGEFQLGLERVRILVEPSMEAEALRGLRPCSDEWYKNHPGMHGLQSWPDLKGLLDALPEALRALAKSRSIEHFFCAESTFAADPFANLSRLTWSEIAPGAWAAYMPEDKSHA